MIKVYIGKGVVEIKGHSGYAEMGKDIVCAGVSALFYAFSGYLEEKECLTFEKSEAGRAVIMFTDEGKEGLLMFTEGVNRIAKAYPKFVKVINK
ncbi:MAG: ribosomal-processing cysteine protease Prp [Clostridia bacterium]|nr:ribosomal-processing cysteine protease Prp [Clostridia bacterium]